MIIIARIDTQKVSHSITSIIDHAQSNPGQEEDLTILKSNKISGNFGEVSYINLLNVPNFNDKDKFLKWAHKALNL